MKRKLIAVSLLISVTALLLSSCSLAGPHLRERLFDNDGPTAKKRFEQILEAMQSKDQDSMKKLFCKQALVDAKDIDEEITNLFEFFQGEVVSSNSMSGPDTSEERNADGSGNHKKEIYSICDVQTDNQKYCLAIKEITIDTANPDNVGGIYSLCIIKAEDSDQEVAYWGGEKFGTPGIVIDSKKES